MFWNFVLFPVSGNIPSCSDVSFFYIKLKKLFVYQKSCTLDFISGLSFLSLEIFNQNIYPLLENVWDLIELILHKRILRTINTNDYVYFVLNYLKEERQAILQIEEL